MSTILWLLLTAAGAMSELTPSSYAPRDLEVLDANSESSALAFLFRMHVDAPVAAQGVISVVFPSELTFKASTTPVCTIRYIKESVPTCTFGNQVLKVILADPISSNSTLFLKAEGFDGVKYTGGTQHFQIYTKNFTDGEARDVNFSFGQLGFLPVPATIDPLTATLTVDSKLVNATTDYTLEFTAIQDIYSGSEFRLTLPTGEWPGPSSTTPCEVSARNYPVFGSFYCYKDRYTTLPTVRVAGLINDIPASTRVIVKFKTMVNPVCKVAQKSLLLNIVAGGTYASRQRLVINLFSPDSGTLKDVTQKPFNSYASFYQGNKVLVEVSFTTTTGIPSGGKVNINFNSLAYITDTFYKCYLKSNSFFLNGATPSCSLDGTTGKLAITGMPNAPSGTTFKLVVRVLLGTANIPAPSIDTLDKNDCVIDQNNNKIGGIVLRKDAKNPDTRDASIITGKTAWSTTYKISAANDFKIGQMTASMPSLWRPYPAEKVFCMYTYSSTTLGVQTFTTVNIPQELCTYNMVDNVITWTPTTAVTISSGETISLQFAHRLLNSKEDYSWRPLVASSLSTYHEFVLRIYDATLTLQYADHKLANVDPFNGKGSTFSAPGQFPSDMFAPVTIIPEVYFDEIPTDSNMQTFLEVRFFLKNKADTSNTWVSGLGFAGNNVPCNLVLPLQSLSSTSLYYCQKGADQTTNTGQTYVPVRVWNIGPLQRYLKPTLKILAKGPATTVQDLVVHVGFGYYLNNQYFNYQQMDIMTYDIGKTAAVSGDFSIRTRPAADLYCQQSTFFTMSLTALTSVQTSWTILLHFPSGWSFSEISLRSKAGTCASPKLYISPDASVVECQSFTLSQTDSNFEIQTRNPAYSEIGKGKVRILLADGTSASTYFTSTTDLPSCTAASTITTSGSVIPAQSGAVGATVYINFALQGVYDSGDSVLIAMDTKGKYTNGLCMPASNVATCVLEKDSNFRLTVSSGTVKDIGRVELKQVLLPVGTSFTYSISVCKGSADCTNTASVSATTSVALSATVYSGELLISKVELFPHNRVTDSHLHVQMVAAKAIPSRSVITLKGSFNWPASDGFTYKFSHQYRSISASSTSLSITVGKRILPMEFIELECYYVNLATAGTKDKLAQESITGSVSYYGSTFLTTPTVIPDPQTFIPGWTATSSITLDSPTLDFMNAGERAAYSFTVRNLQTAVSSQVVEFLRIRFPAGYRLSPDVTCQIDTPLVSSCQVMSDFRSVMLPLGVPMPTGNLAVRVAGVVNPAGTTTGFSAATIFNSTLLDESKATTAVVTFTSPANIFDLMVLNLTKTLVREPSSYLFLAKSYSGVSTDSNISFAFSDQWRLQGVAVTCEAKNWTFTGRSVVVDPNATVVSSVVPCSNDKTNSLRLDPSAAQLGYNASLLNLTINNIVNPNSPGFPSDITAAVYSLSSKAIWAKTYPHLSQGSVTNVISQGFRLLAPEHITIAVGTAESVKISTVNYSKPARFNLLIAGNSSNTLLKLREQNLTIAQGNYEAIFVLKAETTLAPGTYFIYWTVSGHLSPLLYENLPVLRVDVISALLPVSLQPIPVLKANVTSFPLLVRLPSSPATNLTVTLSSDSNATLTPSRLDFLPGKTEASYTVTTGNLTNVLGSVSFSLSGPDAATYWLPQSILGFSVSIQESSKASIIGLKVWEPYQPHSAKLTIRTDNAAQLFWICQEEGLAAPTADNVTNLGSSAIVDPERRLVDLTLERLAAYSSYDWYGVLVSVNGLKSDVQKTRVRTAAKVNPVRFTIELQGPDPSDSYLSSQVQMRTATVLGVPICSLTITQVALNSPVDGTHQVTFRLDGQDSDVHQSPKETVLSLSNADYLSKSLANYTVKSFASSLTESYSSAPSWRQLPRLFNGNSSMVQIVFKPAVDGYVYVAAYGKTEAFPSAKDVKWGRTRTRGTALYSAWKRAFADKTDVISLTGLAPSSNYVIYVVLQNSRTDSQELTDPYLLTVPQAIYTYLNAVSEISTATLIAVLTPALALSLF